MENPTQEPHGETTRNNNNQQENKQKLLSVITGYDQHTNPSDADISLYIIFW